MRKHISPSLYAMSDVMIHWCCTRRLSCPSWGLLVQVPEHQGYPPYGVNVQSLFLRAAKGDYLPIVLPNATLSRR